MVERVPDDARQALFDQVAQVLPARAIATADDIAEVVVLAATTRTSPARSSRPTAKFGSSSLERLGFDLIEDSPSVTHDGRPKRWVRGARPPGAETGLLLAQTDAEDQASILGRQVAGRVGAPFCTSMTWITITTG